MIISNLPNDIIERYKLNNDESSRFQLPIADSHGSIIGTLKCIDHLLAKDQATVNALTSWRTQYMHFFLTQFPATPQRTAGWLEKVVLPGNDRILFLICTDKNEPIGNFGVCNISQISGELDNIIKGRKGDHSRIMYYSAVTILAWMFGSLSIKFANIHVFSNNIKAINLYSSVGFTLSKSQELRRLEIGDEIHFLVDSDDGDLVNFQYNEMILARDTFLHLHPWTVQVYPNT